METDSAGRGGTFQSQANQRLRQHTIDRARKSQDILVYAVITFTNVCGREMWSLLAAVFLVTIVVLALRRVSKRPGGGFSAEGTFAKMLNLLHNEDIQNKFLDERLRGLLADNDIGRKCTAEYGYLPNDPIRVNGPLGEQLYIAMLRGMDGQAVIGHRLGSLKQLDIFEVATSDFTQWAVLVFDMYYLSKDTVAPDGFTIDPSGIRTLTAVNRFMANFPGNFYSELVDAISEQIGFPLVNTLLGDIQSEGITRPAAHQELMNQIVVASRAEGIGIDS